MEIHTHNVHEYSTLAYISVGRKKGNLSPGSPSFHTIILHVTFFTCPLFFGQVKDHTQNYCAEGGRAWGRG